MISNITVRNVREVNDCAGKKFIDVTAMEADETTASRFRLTRYYMPERHKLMLSTVSPMDEVVVEIENDPISPFYIGDYVDNKEHLGSRDPLCKCGRYLVSDGFDVYCPSDNCALTLVSRIERLGSTEFFRYDIIQDDFPGRSEMFFTESMMRIRPFSAILQTRFWGEGVGTIENALLKPTPMHISLATFLVEPLLRDFIDCTDPFLNDHQALAPINDFFGYMQELTERRDYNSVRQNRFLKEFLWALGIESLSDSIIDKLIIYEMSLGHSDDVLLPYAYLLTHPGEMARELTIHPLEARSIAIEFGRRRYEFYDIFRAYSPYDEVMKVFEPLMKR